MPSLKSLLSLLSLRAITLALAHNSSNPLLATGANLTFALPTHPVHTFPVGTWIENLAVRENGQIIATDDTHPRIYQIDPYYSHTPALLLHEFNNTASILGIVETTPDVFYVCTANYSSAKLEGYGEAYIYRLDMRPFSSSIKNSAVISKIATLLEAKALDGLTWLEPRDDAEGEGLLLISDFLAGVIWSVKPATGAVAMPINSTYTRSTGFGVNGLKIRNRKLYLTNSQQQTLVKVLINSKGEAVGNYTVLAQGGFTPDDFALDAEGNAYVTSFEVGRNGVVFVPREGGQAVYIPGMAGPTAAAFGRGREEGWLYVSTSGGDYDYLTGKEVTAAGGIVRVQVGGRG
ncbi:uncharacterized protein BDZ99DRAFT_557478 [Mytilinidion resinicola]|uniref:SMP-30/Gluconolactonase/LRE-like region domain-containing protein n=1 Tax=Mytilinidion resinicola TaxID=574789 RepID=A0A6A6Z030_9PEZI|nr:uncharacterized protein BDZ99DRAFT_557478 [Mytilinidion resinicola]KAF2813577.1 hypothetical protein BDZ99DRAFT_557478 [Mytilinidion resinicola]